MARARHPSLLLLLLSILTLFPIKIAAGTASPAPPPPLPDLHEKRLDDIIDVLISSGDFSEWAHLLSSGDVPFRATFFIPAVAGDSRNGVAASPFAFAYHIVPRRLSFSDLLLLENRARLPTLLRGKSILVTNCSAAGFSLDDAPLTVPDLYSSPSIAVHAVAAVLDYKLYGDADEESPPQPLGVAVNDPPASAGAPPCGSGASVVFGFLASCALLLAFSDGDSVS